MFCLFDSTLHRPHPVQANRLISGKVVSEKLAAASQYINDTASEVNAGSCRIAANSADQAAAVEEISASMEEMSAITQSNAENAGNANENFKAIS